MRWLTTVAVLAVLLTAGCAALGPPDPDTQSTVTPVPVPEQTPAQLAMPPPPPGVTDEGLNSISRLAGTHQDALAKTTSYTLTERFYVKIVTENESFQIQRNETVTVESRFRYRDELVRTRQNGTGTVDRYEQSTFADGAEWFRRQDDGSPTYERDQTNFGREQFAHRTAYYLTQYGTARTTDTTVVQRDGDRYYLVTGTGGRLPTGEEFIEYRFELFVGTNGLVEQFTVKYRTPNEEASYQFRYDNVNATTVETPGWVQRYAEGTTAQPLLGVEEVEQTH